MKDAASKREREHGVVSSCSIRAPLVWTLIATAGPRPAYLSTCRLFWSIGGWQEYRSIGGNQWGFEWS
jgi:hypothetical protein